MEKTRVTPNTIHHALPSTIQQTHHALRLLAECVEVLAGHVLTSYKKDHAVACAVNARLAELGKILAPEGK